MTAAAAFWVTFGVVNYVWLGAMWSVGFLKRRDRWAGEWGPAVIPVFGFWPISAAFESAFSRSEDL